MQSLSSLLSVVFRCAVTATFTAFKSGRRATAVQVCLRAHYCFHSSISTHYHRHDSQSFYQRSHAATDKPTAGGPSIRPGLH